LQFAATFPRGALQFAPNRTGNGEIKMGRIERTLGTLFLFLALAAPAWAMDRGEYLARAGDCVACHSVPGGKAFAGGLKMGTPLGNIYSTNITPDKETGIGDYSLADFDAALRRGVARDGHHLYPAMPYPSYAKLTDGDVAALYGFFMKEVPAANVPNRPSEIPWPFSMRWPIALWNVVFMDHAVFQPKSGESETWNRGAYLVEGLGHCGACHTPRGVAWNEEALDSGNAKFLAGAMLDFWSAPNLRGDANAGLGRWSKADLVQFLKTGHNRDGAVFGSMIDVINNSSPYLSDADLDAIATYIKSLPATDPNQPAWAYDDAATKMLRAGHPTDRGAAIYLGQCVSCHVDTGMGFAPFLPPLAGNPTLLDGDPSSLINIVLNGSNQIVIKGTPDAYRMPQFRINLSDQEIADVVTFIRQSWGNHAGAVTADQVAHLRKATDPSSDQVVILKMR
jgi:mono/diheme cytochrome c family protein